MALREKLLPVLQNKRAFIESLGLRPNALTIRKRTHIGTPGVDAYIDEDLVITPKPRVREVSTREISGSGGRYAAGDLRIDKITPQYTDATGTHGYTPAQIDPTIATRGVDVIYLITGTLAGDYALVDANVDRNFGYSLVVTRKRSTP